jgi:uncharacterized protein YecE (DUF72 family)
VKFLLGCSGWNYPDTADKGGWTGVFYPDKDTKRLRYYSQFFNTAEMDSTFYDRFYSQMTKGTFIGMSRATPEKFQFSIKVPETITHVKRLDVNKEPSCSSKSFWIKYPLHTHFSAEKFSTAKISDELCLMSRTSDIPPLSVVTTLKLTTGQRNHL